MQRRRDNEKDKAEAPTVRAPGDAAEEAPDTPPRRTSVVRRGNGRPGDMGDWVIDEAE